MALNNLHDVFLLLQVEFVDILLQGHFFLLGDEALGVRIWADDDLIKSLLREVLFLETPHDFVLGVFLLFPHHLLRHGSILAKFDAFKVLLRKSHLKMIEVGLDLLVEFRFVSFLASVHNNHLESVTYHGSNILGEFICPLVFHPDFVIELHHDEGLECVLELVE